MKKIKEFFEEEMSGEPLTQEKVEWALEKFAKLAYIDGYLEQFMNNKFGKQIDNFTYEDWLNKSYTERDQELVHL